MGVIRGKRGESTSFWRVLPLTLTTSHNLLLCSNKPLAGTTLDEAIASDVWPRTCAFHRLMGAWGPRAQHEHYSLFLSLLISLVGKGSIKQWPSSLREQRGQTQENTQSCVWGFKRL